MSSYGLALPVYLTMQQVFRSSNPELKLTPRGYLDYLLHNNKPTILSDTIDDRSGYIRDVKVRYRKRMGLGRTVTTDDCSIQGGIGRFEMTLPSTLFRKFALFFPWSVIEKFSEDALAMRNLPNSTPPTQVMQIVIDDFQQALNGILGDINDDLLSIQAASFGKNAVNSLNTPKTFNIPLSTTTNDITQGFTMLMADAMANEVVPDFIGAAFVGSGLINNFYLKQDYDPAKTPKIPAFYYDPRAQAKWGVNQFGLFERDAVQFVNICRFRGAAKSGRFGTSKFGTMKWPVRDSFGGTGLSDFEFDFQVRELDCPTDDMVIGGGDPQAVGRGVVFDLMASYQQVNIPADAYEDTDPLTGTNGTFRYTATNA